MHFQQRAARRSIGFIAIVALTPMAPLSGARADCGQVYGDFYRDLSFGELAFCLTPTAPSPSDEVTLGVRALFGDTGQQLVSQSLSLDGNQIDLGVVMQDLHNHPDGYAFAQVVTLDGADFDLGQLAPGVYNVDASVLATPWPFTDGDGPLLSSRSDTFSFEVSGLNNTGGNDGDFNGDGLIDAADYTVWRDAMSSGGQADANGDGLTNETDRQVWAGSLGGGGGPAAVPEPAGFAVLLMAIAAAAGSRQLGS